MIELELELLKIIDPPSFFKGWTEEEYIRWLHIDLYGNEVEVLSINDLIPMLKVLDPYEELAYLYIETLKQLSKYGSNL